jgi:hypothetical protein
MLLKKKKNLGKGEPAGHGGDSILAPEKNRPLETFSLLLAGETTAWYDAP